MDGYPYWRHDHSGYHPMEIVSILRSLRTHDIFLSRDRERQLRATRAVNCHRALDLAGQ